MQGIRIEGVVGTPGRAVTQQASWRSRRKSDHPLAKKDRLRIFVNVEALPFHGPCEVLMKTDLENSGMIDIRGLLQEMKRRDENARFERVFSVSQVRRREPMRLEPAVPVAGEARLRPAKRGRWVVVAATIILASLGGNAFALAQKIVSYQHNQEIVAAVSLAGQRAEVSRARSAARRGHSAMPAPNAFASNSAPSPAALVASPKLAAAGADHQRGKQTYKRSDGEGANGGTIAAKRREDSSESSGMMAHSSLPPSTVVQGPPVDLEAAIRASVGPSALHDAPVVGPSNSKDYEAQARQLRPSAGAIMAAVGGAQSGARRCLAAGDEPRTCKITFRNDGSVARVQAAGGDAASACIEAAFARAHTDAFADASYTATVIVRP